jgi:hypothetical protein
VTPWRREETETGTIGPDGDQGSVRAGDGETFCPDLRFGVGAGLPVRGVNTLGT